MQLKFDWLIVLENLHRGIMVTDANLEGPGGPLIIYINRAWMKMTGYDRADVRGKTPRILQGKRTNRALLREIKQKLLKRDVFRGQTWNYRKNGEPFLMNWCCYAIYGELGKPLYYVAEHEDVTAIESLRLKLRLLAKPLDPEANEFFAVLNDYKVTHKQQPEPGAPFLAQLNGLPLQEGLPPVTSINTAGLQT